MTGGRNLLFAELRRILRRAALPKDTDPRTLPRRGALSRRQFLGATAGAALLPAWQGAPPRIVIVGAGLAGLSAGLFLKDSKVRAAIYEGNQRVGGRVLTARNLLGEGITAELGAEFIDTSHTTMLELVKRFKLTLNDITAPGERGLVELTLLFDGKIHTPDELEEAFRPFTAQIAKDAEVKGAEMVRLDRTPMSRYLAQIGIKGWLREMLEVAYIGEYGGDPSDQSALNLINTIGTDLNQPFWLYGESDERFRVLGGNSQVPEAMYAELKDQVHFGHMLESIRPNASGGYRLTFRRGPGSSVDVEADAVVMAIPFTMLRNVDVRVPMTAEKKRAIKELGYGTNVKLLGGFSKPAWRDVKHAGNGFADLPWQACWDNSRGQGKPAAGMTFFLGGKVGLRANQLNVKPFVDSAAASLDAVWPGMTAVRVDKQSRMYWPGEPFVRASYSMYRPGQWTRIRGQEAQPVGSIFFAGEHCSEENQGFMEGAAETGRKAAEAILRR